MKFERIYKNINWVIISGWWDGHVWILLSFFVSLKHIFCNEHKLPVNNH